MTVDKHGRWFLLSLNFAFVTWGVLFLVGLMHSIFRNELRSPISLKIILGAAGVLHFFALILVLTAFYNGAAYIIRRFNSSSRFKLHLAFTPIRRKTQY